MADGNKFKDEWQADYGKPPPSEILQQMPMLESNAPDDPDVALGE